MALTAQEKVKTRHHLGYLGVAQAYTFVFGIPAAVQTQFSIEGAMDRLLAESEAEYRRQLDILDNIEQQMNDDRELLAVTKVGEIDINSDEMNRLRKEYDYWRRALANMLGVAPNPFDQRLAAWGYQVNAPVQH